MRGEIMQNAKQQEVIRLKLKSESPYYPDWIEKEIGDSVYFSTILRHKKGETWYAEHHLAEGHYNYRMTDKKRKQVRDRTFKRFITRLYLSLRFGEIKPEMTDGTGGYLWPEDDLQKSEKERLGI